MERFHFLSHYYFYRSVNSGRRLYHYNEDDLNFDLIQAWIHINIEVKRSYQLKKLFLTTCKLFI